jgi:hypothetical protein
MQAADPSCYPQDKEGLLQIMHYTNVLNAMLMVLSAFVIFLRLFSSPSQVIAAP